MLAGSAIYMVVAFDGANCIGLHVPVMHIWGRSIRLGGYLFDYKKTNRLDQASFRSCALHMGSSTLS
jgi:hypothetical protein